MILALNDLEVLEFLMYQIYRNQNKLVLFRLVEVLIHIQSFLQHKITKLLCITQEPVELEIMKNCLNVLVGMVAEHHISRLIL